MLMKEYRICMPLTVEEYRIGQLYMISKHSLEQSERGEGVEVVQNEPYVDPEHGSGQFTEKRIYLNNKLPSWARAVVPKIFYVTEKAWNYYPYTITEYTCSFLPKFSIHIETKYEDNKGSNDNIFGSEPREEETEVWFVDIAYDEIPERHYKESEDLRYFKSKKTNRGLLQEGWINNQEPIMCSYKLVTVKFEVWGLQTRVEQFVHKVIRDVLLLGHRQAFAWVDEWIGSHLDAILHLGNLCPAEQPFDSPKSNDRLGRSSFAKKLGLRCDSLSLAMETSPDDYRIQSFDLDTQMLLKTALKDPSSVNLDKVSSVIVDQSLKDQVFSKEAGRICYTIVQAEAKQSNGNVFRRNLLNRLQQEFKNREATRGRSLQEWVCYVTFICNIFDYLKVNNMPMVALVHPVFDCLTRLAQPDALVNEEEVDCLVLQLHRIGEQLEKVNNQRMDELFFLLRDGFLLQEGLTSMARLLLLEILEFRAGGWLLSGTAHKYYYSEIAD